MLLSFSRYLPTCLDFGGPKRAWIEVHNNCLSEDFTRNLCECYVCWILEYVVVTVFRTLELDNETMGSVSLGIRYLSAGQVGQHAQREGVFVLDYPRGYCPNHPQLI